MIWFPKEKSRRNQILGDSLNEAFEGGRASQRFSGWRNFIEKSFFVKLENFWQSAVDSKEGSEETFDPL